MATFFKDTILNDENFVANIVIQENTLSLRIKALSRLASRKGKQSFEDAITRSVTSKSRSDLSKIAKTHSKNQLSKAITNSSTLHILPHGTRVMSNRR